MIHYKFRYLLVCDDATTLHTSDEQIAEAAAEDGQTVVVDLLKGTSTFDSDVAEIELAKSADWTGEGDEEEDGGDE